MKTQQTPEYQSLNLDAEMERLRTYLEIQGYTLKDPRLQYGRPGSRKFVNSIASMVDMAELAQEMATEGHPDAVIEILGEGARPQKDNVYMTLSEILGVTDGMGIIGLIGNPDVRILTDYVRNRLKSGEEDCEEVLCKWEIKEQ